LKEAIAHAQPSRSLKSLESKIKEKNFSLLFHTRPLTIEPHIFTTLISQIAKGAKSETDQLFVKWIQLAKCWNMNYLSAKEGDISFKRALSWDESAEQMSHPLIPNFNVVAPLLQGVA
jgi:hypothetical protein